MIALLVGANELNELSSLCCRGNTAGGEEAKVVAVDLQAMAPIPGVVQIQGDITKVRITLLVQKCFEEKKNFLGLLYCSLSSSQVDIVEILPQGLQDSAHHIFYFRQCTWIDLLFMLCSIAHLS